MVIYKFLTSSVIIASSFLFQDSCYAMTSGEQDDFQKQKPVRTATSKEIFPLNKMNERDAWRSVTKGKIHKVAELKKTKPVHNVFSVSQMQKESVKPSRSPSPPVLDRDRKEIFQTALRFFSSLAIQSTEKAKIPPQKNPAPLKKKKDTTELLPPLKTLENEWPEPDWSEDGSSDDDAPKRFSLKTSERAADIKEQLASGNSISNILTQSKDWFGRNHGLYTEATLLSSVGKQGIPQAYKQKAIENPDLAKELMLKAHEAGFPSATFDLLKEAIKAKKMNEAKSLLLTVCKNLINHFEELDSQNVEKLVKDIHTLVNRNPELQDGFNMFKTAPLFQQTAIEKPEMNNELKKKYGEADKTLQSTIEELFDNELRWDDAEE